MRATRRMLLRQSAGALLAPLAGRILAQQPPPAQQDAIFVCPMDPDVRGTKPGVCSRCGMKLVAGLRLHLWLRSTGSRWRTLSVFRRRGSWRRGSKWSPGGAARIDKTCETSRPLKVMSPRWGSGIIVGLTQGSWPERPPRTAPAPCSASTAVSSDSSGGPLPDHGALPHMEGRPPLPRSAGAAPCRPLTSWPPGSMPPGSSGG